MRVAGRATVSNPDDKLLSVIRNVANCSVPKAFQSSVFHTTVVETVIKCPVELHAKDEALTVTVDAQALTVSMAKIV